ncbi:MAG: cytochrome c biogenesis protein CcsA [Solirubrobacterales bacterium]|nr:cytochrome c biogenesis protein CcsA [Solirubrobacterales bacterium]
MSKHARHLRGLTIATLVFFLAGLALTFFYAPDDVNQGFAQKIFYIHVPLAIVSLCGYVLGGVFGVIHLRTRERIWDLRSYTAIHMSLIFSVGGLLSGAIWAKVAWGHWWVWSEPTLVSYLIVVLLFCTYQPLRFSIEDPERQSMYASVFSVVAGAFVPLNFLIVRLSEAFVHPRVLNLEGGTLPGSMALAFYVMVIAVALLFATLMKFEMLAKETRGQTRRLRRKLLGDDAVAPVGRSAAPL